MTTRPDVSVVLPTFQEAASIVRVVSTVRGHVLQAGRTVEVLVVDDGSPDGTADAVAAAFPPEAGEGVVLLRRSPPPGLAFSIRDGLERAQGEVLVVMDADGNHDPADLPRLLDALAECDLASGSRFLPGGGMYSAGRHSGSRAMNAFVRLVLRTEVTDSLAGYFAMSRPWLDRLPADRIFWGYGDYFIRLLWHAKRAGAVVREVPVVYPPRLAGESKTRFVATGLRYVYEVLRLALWG